MVRRPVRRETIARAGPRILKDMSKSPSACAFLSPRKCVDIDSRSHESGQNVVTESGGTFVANFLHYHSPTDIPRMLAFKRLEDLKWFDDMHACLPPNHPRRRN